MFIKSFPDELELLAFFESEPVLSDADDLHFAYKANDNNGVGILFSFCITAGWIKTVLSCNGIEMSTYLSENIGEIALKKDKSGEFLYSEIITDDSIAKVEIRISPYISVKTSSLVR